MNDLRAKIKFLNDLASECEQSRLGYSKGRAVGIREALRELTPPATAKLPEGVEVVETNVHPKFDVRTATQYLGRNGQWYKRGEGADTVGCFGTRDTALSALRGAGMIERGG